ncbi:MAG TPA: hypothetical protein VFP12_01200 [Allosphingosinicella sp.]|nr:hypothetical protein [Allosphingosinicella sp.]
MRVGRALIAASLLGAVAAPASAQKVARSAGPQSVAVTVYRAPGRGADSAMDLRWLNGFALVTESRRVSVPAGESDIRFEGVAGGILPESAIVSGLPQGVVEKNQDAWLLSPGSLLDASLGKRVHLRRTSRATGKVSETEAVVRSGLAGAVVIETPDGIESLRCDGLPETLRYDRVPPGLSAKPTLSVRVRSPRAARATVTLSYLASGFDWQANYVASMSPDGSKMDLFAWLTLANGDETGFREADTQAVAGRLNGGPGRRARPQAPPLVLRCWPSGTTTSDLREQVFEKEEIVVTSSRTMDLMMPMAMAPPPPPPAPVPAMMAQQEDLGDLKLYRIPERVTVAARSQKQVALLVRDSVKVDTVYRLEIYGNGPGVGGADPAPLRVTRILTTRNDVAAGLGLPLPAGRMVLFGAGQARPILLGRGFLGDKAVGEELEIPFGNASSVIARAVLLPGGEKKTAEWELTVTNAQPASVRFEALLGYGGMPLSSETALSRRDGRPLWEVTIPANGRAVLRYRVGGP